MLVDEVSGFGSHMGNCCARPTKSEDGKTNTEPQHLHSSKADTTTNSSGMLLIFDRIYFSMFLALLSHLVC